MTEGTAREYCLELMQILEDKKRIDLKITDDKSDPRFSTDYLFGEARGKMFGVLVCERNDEELVILRAFSGQYKGAWDLDGWVPPLLNVTDLHDISFYIEKNIKKLGRDLELLDKGSPRSKSLQNKRKIMSQELMKDIHALYELNNFRGETGSLFQVYTGDNGIPAGTGDCCAPKLLQYAAKNNLKPLGLAEFYWGRENRTGTRQHGQFYPSCEEKCHPILGFMLCGL